MRTGRQQLWAAPQRGNRILPTSLSAWCNVDDCNKHHVQCESMPAVGNTQCNSLQLSLQAPDVLLCVLIRGTSHWWQVFVHVHKCQLLNIRFGEGRVTNKGPELAEPKTLS